MSFVGIFVPEEPTMHIEALHAFAEGLNARSIPYSLWPLEQGYQPCDIVVTFGIGKRRTPRGRRIGEIIYSHTEMGRRNLVVERGFIHRDRYFMVGWKGLNGRANFCNLGCPSDRWDLLGVQVQPWRTDGQHIVLCGQVPWDASVQHTDHPGWCRKSARELIDRTSRKIIFRPHPCQPNAVDLTDIDVEFSNLPTLQDDLKNAWAVVTYNSNAGVEATLAGIPAFAFDQGAMGYSILNKSLDLIETPAMPPREQWLHNLAYTQWTLDELAAGLAFKHLWEDQASLIAA